MNSSRPPISQNCIHSSRRRLALFEIGRLNVLGVGQEHRLPAIEIFDLDNLVRRLGWVTESCFVVVVRIGECPSNSKKDKISGA